MQDPDSELTADPDERADRPDFDALTPPDEVVHGDRTRDDFFDAVLGLDSPATADEVADLAGRGVDAAREYLEWFERMGIVTKVTESPSTYERNQAYLNWRRAQTLQNDYSTNELVEFLDTETTRAQALAEQFDAKTPDAVALSKRAADSGRSVEDVWEEVTAWRTARRRVSLLERALRTDSGDAADRRTIV
ncbi:hypothetical protein SAMN06269185_0243 [Natronoarchaeum philippinense]|uniref:Sugar-specific transcriptional regulator TrmB n=1 Tax=Natronoarchaeum philippinense TaxID=558529 RepID=A0A285N5M9_NATPI|nr:hypothetical protein [Natronoarchaeum philippinense]SNZ03306.1 hypothetical protein SAMN06269185_0243 [Natronoarchaeum philippinense]